MLMQTPYRQKPGPTAWLIAALCAVSGTILYILTVDGPLGAWANLLWGSVYGLGFVGLSFFLAPVPGVGGFILFVAGAFVWPIIATVLIARGTEALLQRHNPRLVIALCIATNLVVYPMAHARGTIVYFLPIYGVFLENF
jgi:hypothetical protein